MPKFYQNLNLELILWSIFEPNVHALRDIVILFQYSSAYFSLNRIYSTDTVFTQ